VTRRPGGPSVDLAYADPRLVTLYDALSPSCADTAFHVRLAGPRPLAVPDLGSRPLDLGRWFDLVLTTGHVFQVCLAEDDARAALATARRHLGEADSGGVRWFGGWDGGPFTPGSPEIVVVATARPA
jgi:hypothetical protein